MGLIIQKELELKRKDEEDAVLSCKQLKEENLAQKEEIFKMKKMQEQSNLESKDDIIRELTLSVEAQKEQVKKIFNDSVDYEKKRKYYEKELVAKDEEISKLEKSYNQSKKELASLKSSVEGLYIDNYFLNYII